MQSLASLMSERSDIPPRLGLLTRDAELAKTLSLLAYDYGFHLTTVEESQRLLETAGDARFDLLLADLSEDLPGDKGCCDVLRQCVERTGLPTMALSSRPDEDARVCALEAGAADFVEIPISTRELATRVLRILSRTNPDLFDRPLTHGDIVMDVAAEKVFRDGKFIWLNDAEFKLLRALMERPQQVVSRAQLLEAVFETPSKAAARTIDVYVHRLRQSLSSPEPGSIIRTVRPIGYSLDKDVPISGQ